MKWLALNAVLEHRFFARIYIWIFVLPVIANIVQRFPKEIKLHFSEAQVLTVQLDLPFSWYLLYIAAVFSYVAYGIYIALCPSFLRAFASAGEALHAGITIQYIRQAQQDFVSTYFRDSYSVSNNEEDAVRRMCSQLRVDMASLEASLPNPDGSKLAKLLGSAVLTTKEGGDVYEFWDSARIQRDQLFKHLFHDLIRLQNVSYPKTRTTATCLLALALLLLLIVVFQGGYYVFYSAYQSWFVR